MGDYSHDAINRMYLVEFRCQQLGISHHCDRCDGHGDIGTGAERDAHDHWERTEPPTGDGYQMWGTTSEGNPMTPVFATLDELAAHCAKHCTTFASHTASAEGWKQMLSDDLVAATTPRRRQPGHVHMKATDATREDLAVWLRSQAAAAGTEHQRIKTDLRAEPYSLAHVSQEAPRGEAHATLCRFIQKIERHLHHCADDTDRFNHAVMLEAVDLLSDAGRERSGTSRILHQHATAVTGAFLRDLTHKINRTAKEPAK